MPHETNVGFHWDAEGLLGLWDFLHRTWINNGKPDIICEFGAKWLIFFTNLSYIQFVLALLLLAILMIINTPLYYCNRRLLHSQLPDYSEDYPIFYGQDNINFAVKFVWFMYTATVSLSLTGLLSACV